MKRFLINILNLCIIAALAFAVASCIEDKSRYDYMKTNTVTFKTVLEGFTFTTGEEAEVTAPIEFSEPYDDLSRIDEDFEIDWYVGKDLIATGYKIKHTFEQSGGFALIFKVINRTTGETYISGSYSVESKSQVGWGWMVLSADSENNSCLSVIAPVTGKVYSHLERSIEGGLGTDPKSLYYYYVLGSIEGSYISGLAKVIVNQGSGTVTLDGRDLQKDKLMKDEFENGSEPEADFEMTGFAWKKNYYLIFTKAGNVYLRCMQNTSSLVGIPYYGTYSSMPYAFDTDIEIGAVAAFQNVTYWAANEDKVLIYDELNSRFLAFVQGTYGALYEDYCPKVVYFSYYDSETEFDASVPKVNALGAGTKCLGLGSYEEVYTDPTYGGLTFYPNYVALMDYGGTGNYYVYEFSVEPMDYRRHTVISNTHTPFSGAGVLSEGSVVKMSTNFKKNPYFYFTDGGNRLYVYSMEAKSHCLLYEASSKITSICSSPTDCPFSNYGANPDTPNFRLALAQEDGKLSIVDVSQSKMVSLFEGFSPKILIGELSGFGDIKSIVWATNYEGEY